MKEIKEKEARQEEEETKEQGEKETEDNIDLTATENKRVLKGAYRRFIILGIPKADINGYADQIKPHIKALIEDKLMEVQSTEINYYVRSLRFP